MEIPIKTLRKIEDWLGFNLPNIPRLTNDFKDCRFGDGKKKNKKDYSLCKAGKGFKAFNWKTGDKKFFTCEDHDFKESVPKYKPQPPKTCETEFNKLSKQIPENHPYLLQKKISAKNLNIRHFRCILYIPVLYESKIISWQQINNDGDKWFKPGHKLPKGHYFPIGESTEKKIYCCEGFATGVSIFQITGQRVYCCFSKGNLDNVAEMLLKKYPKNEIIMCLDNDKKNTHKTEIEDKRLEVVVPDLPGDFNDPQNVNDKEKNKLINGIIKIPKEAKIMQRILNKLGYKLRLNLRSSCIEIWGFMKEKKWIQITDELKSWLYLEVKELKKIKKYEFEDQRKTLALLNKEDPFKTYLERLKWDGYKKEDDPKLENFLFKCFKIPKEANQELAKWAFKSILLAIVKRTFEPGAKHDEFLILKSKQGYGKSSLLYHLLPWGDLFTNSISFSLSEQKKVEIMQGLALCEVAELSGFQKVDIERMKNFITTTRDRGRLPYRPDAQHYPRRCVFVGTTNDNKPLPDDITGNRRFVVINLEKSLSVEDIIKLVKKYRDQLWAEAVYLYKKGESARLPSTLWDISAEISEEHRGGDIVFEDKFREKIAGASEVILADILKEMKDGYETKIGDKYVKKGGGWIRDISVKIQSKAKEILKNLGYEEKRPRKPDGTRPTIWLNEEFKKKDKDKLHEQVYGEQKKPEQNNFLDNPPDYMSETEKPPLQ